MKVLGSTFLTYRQNVVLYTHPYNIVYFIHHSTKCSPKSLEKTVQGTRQGKRALTKAVYNLTIWASKDMNLSKVM